MSTNKTKLLGGKLLAKNSVYSFVGMILPMVAGLLAIPFLLNELGEEEFGLLILVWSTISYITLLDFGINTATTKYFSQNIGRLNETENLNLLITSTFFLAITGVIIGVCLFFGAEILATKIFDDNETLRQLAVDCFKLISFYSPILLLIPAISSFLKSYQNFKWLSIINSSNGILNYVIPVLAIFFSFSLLNIIQALLFLKGVILIALFAVSFNTLNFKDFALFDIQLIKNLKKLISFGGWVSVSNFLAPLFEYSDRFIIASYISISAVTVYATPLEIILKVGMIATAISGVLYAALSNSIEHDLITTEKIINKGLNTITLLTYPIIFTVTLFSEEGLRLWVGDSIALDGSFVLQIIGIGILFKCSTNISIVYLRSINKPKITAQTHLFEFVVYIISLFVLAKLYGLIGVALAHAFRLILDNLLMGYFAQRNSEQMDLNFMKNSKIIILLVISMFPAFFSLSLIIKVGWWLIIATTYLLYLYKNSDDIKSLLNKSKL